MKKVFVIGGTSFDHIVTLPEFPAPTPKTIHVAPFYETTGSTGSGKSLCLTKLGVPNRLYSIVGDDYYGHKIIDHLLEEKVDFIYDFDPSGTERHFNVMNSDGGRISMFITQSSEEMAFNYPAIEQSIQDADIIVLNIPAYCKHFISLLSKYDKPVWTDLHDYDDGNPYHEAFIEVSDYIFMSSDNLSNYRKTMSELMEKGKELIVCTHGKNGSTVLTPEGNWINVPAIEDAKLVDSNGAGDNFFSGFMSAYLEGKSIIECMRFGTICGALCIESNELVAKDLSPKLIESYYQRLYTLA